MIQKSLLDKAVQNIETARFAEEKKYYSTAVSRYYYGLYQRIIFLLNEEDYIKNNTVRMKHVDIIDEFVDNYCEKLAPEQRRTLASLRKLRRLRNEADYDNKCYNDNREFEKIFKRKYNMVDGIVIRVIEKHSGGMENGKENRKNNN